ncbi:MAG: tetratricopeptide repeat protein, partial [bacterium]|nr:tetratricopeptide repeat protein [bacterium]
IEDSNEVDRTGAGNICGELGYLPLAIDHAGAFIEQTGCNLVDYLESFKAKGVDILSDSDYAAEDYQLEGGALRTVATTWLMSIEKVREKNPAAEDILKLSALLAPDGILLELFKSGADSFEEPPKEVVTDSHELNKSLGALQEYSLIRRRQGADQFSMHRLVQAVIRDGIGGKERRGWVERGIACAATALPDVSDYRNWSVCDRIVPHVLSLVEHADRLSLKTGKYGTLLNDVGYYLDDRADYDRAERLYLRALEIREEILGSKHPNVAVSLNNLGLLYDNQGKYEAAEPLYQRSLEIREEVRGSNHPSVATSLNNLAALYQTQGKSEKAEPLYLRALEIREEVLGPKHPDIAVVLNNLALLYKTQDKYDKAEPLYLRALEIDEAAYSSNHPDVAVDLNNLAGLHNTQGRYDKAEQLYLRSLEIREEVLGPKHPNTATSLNNLALLYKTQEKYAKAEPLYLRSLAIREEVLGSKHPSVANSLHNLGVMLHEMGRKKEGVAMVRRAYRIFLTALGPDHPNSKATRSFLEAWGVEPE